MLFNCKAKIKLKIWDILFHLNQKWSKYVIFHEKPANMSFLHIFLDSSFDLLNISAKNILVWFQTIFKVQFILKNIFFFAKLLGGQHVY